MAKVSTSIKSKAQPTEIKSGLFKGLTGEQFGGKSNYLEMEVGQVIGPFIAVGVEKDVKLTSDGNPIDIARAIHPETGEDIRMPAAAIFKKNYDTSNIKPGDKYYVGRDGDAVKKNGKGKGKPMEVYSILVKERA